MADWADTNPDENTVYTSVLDALKDRDLDVAKMMDSSSVTVTNPVTGMKRWNDSGSYWEEYNGSTWAALASTYGVNVDQVDGYHAGNSSGQIPVSNGTVNTNLNADMVDGKHAGTGANQVLLLDGSGLVPQANIPSDIPWSKIVSEPTTISGYGITDAITTAGGTLTSGNITLFQDPSSALHAATKQYVDASAAAVPVKAVVKAATTANITLSGAQTIDGVSCVAADRVLVKNQSTTSQNGIYTVAAGAWSRASDADSWTELVGALVVVDQGTTYADTIWQCTSSAGGTLGSTAVAFSQIVGSGTISAGTGISVSGYTVSLDTSNVLSLYNLAANGLVARTAANTVAARTLTAPAAGITVSNGDGVSGNPTLALANDLSALEALGSTGIAVRTTTDTWAQRTVTGTSNEITVTNGNGVSGNPTLSLPSSLTFTGKTVTGGTFSSPTMSGTIAGTYTIGGTPTFPSTVVLTTGTQTLTNKTLTSPTINSAALSGTFSGTATFSGSVTFSGHMSAPITQNSQSAAYTLVLADAGKHVLHPSSDNNARTFTIPANASVAYPVGTAVTFVNEINTVTIAINTDTLTLAGTGATGSRTLAANGVATALKVASTKWVISGTGLT